MMIIEIFERYKQITNKVIMLLKEDKDVDELMKKRESVLEELGKSKYNKAEKLKCYEALGLDVLDKSLEEIIKDNMLKVKKEIKNTQNRRVAYTSYTSNDMQGNLFAKKV